MKAATAINAVTLISAALHATTHGPPEASREATPYGRGQAMQPRVLMTGALGQLGSDLSRRMRSIFGKDNVISTDIRRPMGSGDGPYQYLDVCDAASLHAAVVNHRVDWVVHLSAIMSVKGEAEPEHAMRINIDGMRNVLEASRHYGLRCFIPSSMAAFGPDAGKQRTPDSTVHNPITIYGITKVFMEQLGGYYHRKFDVDFRCLRYPGLISAETLPGGGTTDYAIHMLHTAIRGGRYTCPVLPDEPLPMMHLNDAVDGTIKFLRAPREQLRRCTYNVDAFSFTPSQLAAEVRKHGRTLEVDYKAGVAQDIAHSWPDTMDDTNARAEWGWEPNVDFATLVKKMLADIPKYHTL